MVLTMGLTDAPAKLMRVMNNLFTDLMDHSIIMFLNDVLVDSHTRDEHVQLFRTVFGKLHEHGLYCKLKKCSFFHTSTTFLGFDITPEGLKISNAKVKSLYDWPQLMTMK